MDPSSIVSFNNDSTLKAEYGSSGLGAREVNVHELALHAMRDRCLLLQRRVHALESDNMRLKLDSADREPCRPLDGDERVRLRAQLADLTKQKSQLLHHVFMVTCENKNLWSRIAGLKKATKRELPQSKCSTFEDSPPKHARLLRTNTYIHSTPKVDIGQEKYSETSLEEISLKLINSYIQEKSQLVEQYEQMSELQCAEEILNLDSIGFAYLEEPGTDSLKEMRNQTEKLLQLKEEISKQEADLMVVLSNVEKFIFDGNKCSSCTQKPVIQPPMEHKEIETSDSLADWATPAVSNTYNETLSEVTNTSHSATHRESSALTELLRGSSEHDKICPMCGQFFKKGSTFADFQEHVESHFVGEPEPDSILDHNFEIVSGSVENNFI